MTALDCTRCALTRVPCAPDRLRVESSAVVSLKFQLSFVLVNVPRGHTSWRRHVTGGAGTALSDETRTSESSPWTGGKRDCGIPPEVTRVHRRRNATRRYPGKKLGGTSPSQNGVPWQVFPRNPFAGTLTNVRIEYEEGGGGSTKTLLPAHEHEPLIVDCGFNVMSLVVGVSVTGTAAGRRGIKDLKAVTISFSPVSSLTWALYAASFHCTYRQLYEHFASSLHDKIDVKHAYTEVDLAIGSQFIRHALDDSEPIAEWEGNNLLIPYSQLHTAVGATVAERLARSPPIKANRVQMPDDAVGRRIFSGISRFPCPFIPASLHIHFITLIGPLYIAVRSRLNLLTHSLHTALHHTSQAFRDNEWLNQLIVYDTTPHLDAETVLKTTFHCWVGMLITLGWSGAGMQGRGKTGVHRENPRGFVQHDKPLVPFTCSECPLPYINIIPNVVTASSLVISRHNAAYSQSNPAFIYKFDSPSTRVFLGWGWRDTARPTRRVMPLLLSMERWSPTSSRTMLPGEGGFRSNGMPPNRSYQTPKAGEVKSSSVASMQREGWRRTKMAETSEKPLCRSCPRPMTHSPYTSQEHVFKGMLCPRSPPSNTEFVFALSKGQEPRTLVSIQHYKSV
ncbi:hypothetical protein PR048_002755 [Dryococelus australis]|uniref:Uncharacterized protein n=1 Tax=Dryococelus australis TaxID=614101 RepID=A0ABQ9IL47_9NEOP|nr:hypothetical protein PR048_002755 [Dryococelus australis]